ncbi:hypothetical protein [Streptomyces sp. NPDC014623]|uniref:hypothetical protein n=1 Tax=Streptomyces sp. NPDC014623 TaxID=3364875 RepID=UPI0036F556E6
MSLQERYAEWLDEFDSDVRVGITESLQQGEYGTLKALIFREDERGVWVEAEIQRRGNDTPWTCRRVVITPQGPLDSALLASTIFSSAVIEDLDTQP